MNELKNKLVSKTLIVAVDRHEMFSRFDDFREHPTSNLPALLKEIKEDGVTEPDAVFITGDYVGRFGGGGNFPFSLSDIDEEIASVYGEGRVPAYYTYGSHDKKCYDSFREISKEEYEAKKSSHPEPAGKHGPGPMMPPELANIQTTVFADFHHSYDRFLSGPVRMSGYYLYGVSFSQVNYSDNRSADESLEEKRSKGRELELDMSDPRGISAEDGAQHFLEWVHSLTDHDPIVVGSHMPLHFNRVRKDNLGGSIWAHALNEAAETHPVIFIWGHNHTVEEKFEKGDTRMASLDDRQFYLDLPGDRVPFPSGDKKLLFNEDGSPVMDPRGHQDFEISHEELKVRFTYMNAGYLKLGYATAVTFSDADGDGVYDQAELKRYSLHLKSNKNDLTDFGDTGYKSPCIWKWKF